MKGQAASGNALSLEDLGYNVDDLNATFGEYFVSLGEFEGQHYGLPTNSNWKSLIWYPKDDFDKAGYEIPETWDELMALSDQIVADGGTPWCVGFESGTSTGWPATDWVEDIMLATAGQDTYTQWVNHEIPFTDPAVKTAVQDFGDVMFHPGYVLGGADQTPSIAFGDAPLPMFDNPPGCWLHRQATFINAFFPKGTEYGVDYSAFPFPTIDQTGRPVRRRARGRVPQLARDQGLPGQVQRGGVPVRDGRGPRSVEALAERERRAGLLREPGPGRRVGAARRRAEG